MAVFVSGTLAPLGAGPFATNDVQYGLGAWQAFATIAARNTYVTNFPLRCQQGMVALCYDTSPVTLWSLNAPGGGWSGTNSDWTALPGGSGGLPADPLTVAHGGSGLATLTAHAVMLGNTTSNVGFATTGTSGRVLVDQGSGSDPVFSSTGLAINSNTSVITVDTPSGSPPSVTCNLATSNWHQITLTGGATHTTIGLSNVGTNQQFTVYLIQGGSGSNLVTWFGGITWYSGSPPTLQTAAGTFDVVVFKQTGSNTYLGFTMAGVDGGTSSGTVTTVSVASANGFAGSVSNPTTTPAITLSTSITGLLKGNGTAISQAAGSDIPTTGLAVNQCSSLITTGEYASPTTTLNLALTNWHDITLANSVTLALSGVVTNQQFTVVIRQSGSGSFTVTWWGGIKWAGGSPPVLTTAATGIDVFTFKQISTGNYLGFVAGQDFA